MKRIRFRGRDIETDEHVYAELGQVSAEINPEYLTFITDDIHTVDTESVAQLIGIDADGKEIYEGDYVEVVHDGKQYVYQAHLEGFATGNDGTYLTSKQLSKARRI